MLDLQALRNSSNPLYPFKWIRSKLDFYKNHPHYFHADGLTVFVGEQGSGKTLSAVNYVYNLMKKMQKQYLLLMFY